MQKFHPNFYLLVTHLKIKTNKPCLKKLEKDKRLFKKPYYSFLESHQFEQGH